MAIAQNVTIPLASLSDSFPTNPFLARLAYDQSESVVNFITQRYSAQSLPLIISRYEELGDFQSALKSAIGVSAEELDSQWQSSQSRWWSGVRWVLRRFSLFSFLAVLCVIAFLLVRRRGRKKKLKWEKEEWLEQLDNCGPQP